MYTQKNQKWVAVFSAIALIWLSAAFVSHHLDVHHSEHGQAHTCELYSVCKTTLHTFIPELIVPTQFIILFAFIGYSYHSLLAPNRVARSPPQPVCNA